ncbi:MAG: nucleotidyl transferase AbiEii/AbiGii toxin family protein [Phycisphaerae bacterium]|nr:nucleotidyl transferase AbiEii/AbiGii toxin family protein [Phycisphaerae bacterium]
MTEFDVTLQRVVAALAKAGIRFHLTGGWASSLYGEPRFTQDIDVVIDCRGRASTAAMLLEVLSEEFVLSEEALRDAVRTGELFQAIDQQTLVKVDFHTAPRIPGELNRSVTQPLFPGLNVPVVSREDAILSKLLWIRQGSQKSRHDVVGMLMNPSPLDVEYLRSAARNLNVHSLLAELERQADAMK